MPMPRFMIPSTLMSPHRPQAPAPARFCSRVTIHQCKNYNTINIDTNTASIWHIKHILCIFCNVSINLQIYYIYMEVSGNRGTLKSSILNHFNRIFHSTILPLGYPSFMETPPIQYTKNINSRGDWSKATTSNLDINIHLLASQIPWLL